MKSEHLDSSHAVCTRSRSSTGTAGISWFGLWLSTTRGGRTRLEVSVEVLAEAHWRLHLEIIVVVAISVGASVGMIIKWVERRIVEYLRWVNVRDIRIWLSAVHLRMHCRLHILFSKTPS